MKIFLFLSLLISGSYCFSLRHFQTLSDEAEFHYGDPKYGCLADERAVKIGKIPGDFCAPKCESSGCPSDLPQDVKATPACALQDANSGNKFCALICRTGEEGVCGSKASCKPLGFLGICTYND